MTNAVEIAEMPEDRMLETLKDKPHEFFKSLKNLPDSLALKLYKDFARRWNNTKQRVRMLEELVKDIKWEDHSVEENRYDIISELMDKAMQGFEISDEHENRRIPFGHRLVLEARLLDGMDHAFNVVEDVLRDFYGKDEHFANNERDNLRLEIRLMDMLYTEVHTTFLKSYLDMKW